MPTSISIGIRATPHEIYYSVLTGSFDEFKVSLVDVVVVPKALELPEQLKYLRSTFADIINENKVTIACIRVIEPTAQKIDIRRTYIEGVLQELIASSTIERYYTGQVSSISARLTISRDEFKPLLKSSEYVEFEFWKKMNPESRESFLAARSAFNI